MTLFMMVKNYFMTCYDMKSNVKCIPMISAFYLDMFFLQTVVENNYIIKPYFYFVIDIMAWTAVRELEGCSCQGARRL